MITVAVSPMRHFPFSLVLAIDVWIDGTRDNEEAGTKRRLTAGVVVDYDDYPLPKPMRLFNFAPLTLRELTSIYRIFCVRNFMDDCFVYMTR